MLDNLGRNIDYMRISLTDRCNLRCRYCMPDGLSNLTSHNEQLSYEELLRLCTIAVRLGITKFKITGGEPLVRKDASLFIKMLKSTPGVDKVTMTTNGIFLDEHIDALASAGLDAVNISLDTLDSEKYKAITAYDKNNISLLMLKTIKNCIKHNIYVKINTVLIEENFNDIVNLASLAKFLPIDVRFIELMPIGPASNIKCISPDIALKSLKHIWPDLTLSNDKPGNGPAVYYSSSSLCGHIGFIEALSHNFCQNCNRIRLTSIGQLKPCLCYDNSTDLRTLLRNGSTDIEILDVMKLAIQAKPQSHCFSDLAHVTEHKYMNQIGG